MNPDKVEVKIGVLAYVASRVDEMAAESRRRVDQCLGAKAGYERSRTAVEALFAHVEKDIDAGSFPEQMAGLDAAKRVKLYIQRAVEVCASLSARADVEIIAARGRVEGMEAIQKDVQKQADEEREKVRAFLEHVERGDVVLVAGEYQQVNGGARVPGVHPGPSLKQQRAETPALSDESPPSVEGDAAPQFTDVMPVTVVGKRKRKLSQ